MREKGASEVEIATELLAYQAAAFLLNGPEKDQDVIDPIPTAAAENLAEQMKDLGLTGYVKHTYKNGVQKEDLHYEHFLALALDKLNLSQAGLMADDKERVRQQLNERLENVPMNYVDYWGKNVKRNEKNLPYKNSNVFTYEHKPAEDDWKLFSATAMYMSGRGGKPFKQAVVEEFKEGPVNQLVMKNKQTIEKMRRGDYEGVKNAAYELRRSFKFADMETLKNAQREARIHLDFMAMTDATRARITKTREWKELREAIEQFADAQNNVDAIALSANVLNKAEKFTKGRKSVQSDETVQRCVDYALDAIAICVPDATNNPSVKPLIDRFNQVRKWHLFQDPVRLNNYGFAAAAPGDRDVISREQLIGIKGAGKNAETFLDYRPKQSVVPLNIVAPDYKGGTPGFEEGHEEYIPIENVYGPKNEFYNAVKMNQPLERGMVMDAMATIVASEELRYTDIFSNDGYKVKIDLRAFDERVTQLKKDPAISNMVDAMMENDGQMAQELFKNARKEDKLGTTKEAMGVLVNRLYQKLSGKRPEEQEEDVKEEEIKENDLNRSSESNLLKGI